MNTELYPWLNDFSSPEAKKEIEKARELYIKRGAVVFPNFVTQSTIAKCVADSHLDTAYSTDEEHTPYLRSIDTDLYPRNSIYNHAVRRSVLNLCCRCR